MRLTMLFFALMSFHLQAQPSIYTIKNLDLLDADHFGASVATSSDYIVVGNTHHKNRKGSICIYKKEGSEWVLQNTLLHSDGVRMDFMGTDVAMTDKHIIVGAPGDHNDLYDEENLYGRAFIYSLEEDGWQEQAILEPSTSIEDYELNLFGQIVNIHDNYAVVGTPWKSGGAGGVIVYHFDGEEWNEMQILESPKAEISRFGGAIDLADDWLTIGAYERDFQNLQEGGKFLVYMFKLENDQWVEKQKLEYEPQNLSYQIPWAGVELSNDQLIVSNYRRVTEENLDGELRVYRLEDDLWMESQRIHPDGFGVHEIGKRVALSDEFAMIGARLYPAEDAALPNHFLIYRKVYPSTWELIGDYGFPASPGTDDNGFDLDISNNYAVASSHFRGNIAGEVYVLDLREFVDNQNLLREEEILVYPIPTENKLNLVSKESAMTKYKIFNTVGQVVQTEKVNTLNLTLELSPLPDGNYWIKINTDQGYLYRQISKIK